MFFSLTLSHENRKTPPVLEITKFTLSLYIFPLSSFLPESFLFLLDFLGIPTSIPANFLLRSFISLSVLKRTLPFPSPFTALLPHHFLGLSRRFLSLQTPRMTDYYSKKSGQLHIQIPVFGDWDNANQLPITQYFASATQAGLIRYSSSSGECAPTVGRRESYGVDPKRKDPTNSHQTMTAKAASHSQQLSKAGKRRHTVEPPLKVYNNQSLPPKPPKPVDEDLYKIPPDQLKHHMSRRNKVSRVLSRCLIPACNS